MSRINGFSAKYISNVITLDWRNLIVEFLHLLWDYIYCCYMMVLNFRKPTHPSLPLRKAPPLISVFSPQARRRKPPYSVLGTATL